MVVFWRETQHVAVHSTGKGQPMPQTYRVPRAVLILAETARMDALTTAMELAVSTPVGDASPTEAQDIGLFAMADGLAVLLNALSGIGWTITPPDPTTQPPQRQRARRKDLKGGTEP